MTTEAICQVFLVGDEGTGCPLEETSTSYDFTYTDEGRPFGDALTACLVEYAAGDTTVTWGGALQELMNDEEARPALARHGLVPLADSPIMAAVRHYWDDPIVAETA
jgi:hypothetical protein